MTTEEKKTDDEQTAVAETKEPEKDQTQAAEGAAQEDGLDELLKEFDERKTQEEAKPAKSEQTTAGEQLDVAALAALEKQLSDMQARDNRRELERVFSDLAEGVQADAVDAEAFLNAMALRDPRLNQAYLNRAQNPKGWSKIMTGLKQDFSKRFGQRVDKKATESRDAVAAAVRSASTAAPQTDLSPNEISEMSKSDFDELQRKLGVMPL